MGLRSTPAIAVIAVDLPTMVPYSFTAIAYGGLAEFGYTNCRTTDGEDMLVRWTQNRCQV